MPAQVLRRGEIEAVRGDHVYDSNAIRAMIAAAGEEAVIPPRSDRIEAPDCDKEKYEARNKAERLCCNLDG